MKHTATPWRSWHDEGNLITDILSDSDDTHIADVFVSTTGDYGECGFDDDKAIAISQANAAHIIRCVNAHDGLVAALSALKAAAFDVNELHLNKKTHSYRILRRALTHARAVLAKVEE